MLKGISVISFAFFFVFTGSTCFGQNECEPNLSYSDCVNIGDTLTLHSYSFSGLSRKEINIVRNQFDFYSEKKVIITLEFFQKELQSVCQLKKKKLIEVYISGPKDGTIGLTFVYRKRS